MAPIRRDLDIMTGGDSSLAQPLVLRGLLIALWVLSVPWSGATEPVQQVPVGPRAIAMGGAFSAVADDAGALFWNPAGLTQISYQEFSGSYANLFQADIRDNVAAFVLPLSYRHVVATDWYHSGFDDPELSFGENRFDFGYAFRIHRTLSMGLNAKYLRRAVDLDGATVVEGTGAGYGLDLGLLLNPVSDLKLGFLVQDAFDTEIESSDGGRVIVYPRNVRAAVAYTWHDRLTAAFDVDDRWHLGTEFHVANPLALRFGIEDDRHGGESPTWGAGFGLTLGPLRFDYARTDHPVLAETNYFGLSFAFNFNPALIRIEKVEADDLYASLYRSYAHSPLGTVVVRNLQDRAIQARIRVEVRALSEAPSEQIVLLRPRATQEVPLTVVLPEKVLAQQGDRPVQLVIAASYESLRLPRTETASTRLVAYGPGAVDWGRGVAQAAAFVTTRDPVVSELSRDVGRLAAIQPQNTFGNRNLAIMAGLIEALGTLGVAYVPDPNNPFAVMSETPHAIDTVHYPRETLAQRAGDCDDTSVLVAALLGSVGIEAAFVDVPQHLFVLADTGLHSRHRMAMGMDERLLVIRDDRVWIPIETTALGRGFTFAWEEGARRYGQYADRGIIEVVEVGAAQQEYPPASLPGSLRPPVLDAHLLGERLSRAGQEVAAWRETYLATRYGEARTQLAPSAAALQEVAQVYLVAGRIPIARARLEEALALAPTSSSVHNNLGVACAAGGDLDSAYVHLETALHADPNDGGVWLNLGLVRYVLGDSAAAAEALREGAIRSGGWAEACGLLGLDSSDDTRRGSEGTLSPQEVRALLKQVLDRVPETPGEIVGADNQAVADTSVVVPPAPHPTTRPRTRVAGSRAGADFELHRLMYWKQWTE